MHHIDDPEHPALRLVGPDETLRAIAPALSADVVVTDRRLAVVAGDRVILDVPYERLRRIQFDIERQRPATLVLVPDSATDEPQVLAIPAEGYRAVAEALAVVGERLHELG